MVLEQFIIDADIIWDQVGKTFFENPEAKPGRIMRVQVVNAGIIEDLTGYTLNLGWTSVRDPSKFGLDAFDDVDITKGIFEIEYTSGMLTNIGPLNASLQLVPPGEGRPIESNNFKLTVKNSAINPEAIQGETSFSTLENALVEVNGWNARIDVVEQDFKDRADALDGAYPVRLTAAEQSVAAVEAQVDLLNRGLGETMPTMASLLAAYPTGDTRDHIVAGNIAEVDTLTVTAIPTAAGNVTITLNGVAKTVAVDPAIQTTTALVATAIRAAVYPGWTTGGTGSVVTFTATTVGARTAPTFSGETTGTTGTFVRTAIGEAANFHRYFWNGTAWTDGGLYQAVELSNKSVKEEHIDDTLKNIILTGELGGFRELDYFTNGVQVSNLSTNFIIDHAFTRAGTIREVTIHSLGGTVRIGVFRKLGSNTFEVLNLTTISVQSGSNVYEVEIDMPEEGLYLSVGGNINHTVNGMYATGFWDGPSSLPEGQTIYPVKSGTLTNFGIRVSVYYASPLHKLANESIVGLDRLGQDVKDHFNVGWGPESSIINVPYTEGGVITNSQLGKTYVIDIPLKFGEITKLEIDSYSEGVVVSILRKLTDTQFEVVSTTSIATVLGWAQYDVNIKMPETGLYLGVSGGIKYNQKPSNSIVPFAAYEFWDIAGYPLEGAIVEAVKSITKLTFGMIVTGSLVNEGSESLVAELNTINARIDNIDIPEVSILMASQGIGDDLSKTLRPVWSENFDTVNNLWVYENCVPSNGLLCEGTAAASHNKYLTFDTWYHKSVVIVNDVLSVFGLMNHNTVKGAAYIVDGLNGQLHLYGAYTGGALPAVKLSVALGFTLISGTEYILEIYKTGWKHTFSITDPKTLDKTTIEFDNATQPSSTTYAGKGWGSPGVISVSGSVLFKNHTYSLGMFPKVKTLFIGDSITEGTNMGANINIKYRWCSLLRSDLYGGNAIIAGRGGATAADVSTRLTDLYALGIKSDIVVVLIGTNERSDSGVTAWKTNIVTIYNQIITQGAVPVICVPPIPSSGASYINQMRDFILEKGWNTIRFDYATTLNRDGVTYVSSYYTDGVHPNQVGGQKMYEQGLIDLGLM